jgi:hypothetical protein
VRAGAGSLTWMSLVMGAATLLAVAVIGFCAWAAWRRLRLVRGSGKGPAKQRGETEFLARITLYLANLSWLGVLFIALPLLFFRNCA